MDGFHEIWPPFLNDVIPYKTIHRYRNVEENFNIFLFSVCLLFVKHYELLISVSTVVIKFGSRKYTRPALEGLSLMCQFL